MEIQEVINNLFENSLVELQTPMVEFTDRNNTKIVFEFEIKTVEYNDSLGREQECKDLIKLNQAISSLRDYIKLRNSNTSNHSISRIKCCN